MTIKQFLGCEVCIYGLQASVLEEQVTDSQLHYKGKRQLEYINLNSARYVYYEEDHSLHRGEKWTERY